MGRLSRAADCQIAYDDDRDIKFVLGEDLPVKQLIAHGGDASVDFGTRKQDHF